MSVDTNVSYATLANAAELGRHILQEVMGGSIADTFNGSPILRATLYDLMVARIQADKLPQLRISNVSVS